MKLVPKIKEIYEVRHNGSKYICRVDTLEEGMEIVDSKAYPISFPQNACVVKVTTEVVYDPNGLTTIGIPKV